MKNFKKIVLAVLLVSGGVTFAQSFQASVSTSSTQVEKNQSGNDNTRDGFKFTS